jgi:AraC-like DNA-binding protein
MFSSGGSVWAARVSTLRMPLTTSMVEAVPAFSTVRRTPRRPSWRTILVSACAAGQSWRRYGRFCSIRRHRLWPDRPCRRSRGRPVRISVRYLYVLFREHGTTVSGWVRRRRLLRCRAELDGADTEASITEIAYRWGLNDSAHFSRLFKASFGMSPTQYRSSRRLGASDE